MMILTHTATGTLLQEESCRRSQSSGSQQVLACGVSHAGYCVEAAQSRPGFAFSDLISGAKGNTRPMFASTPSFGGAIWFSTETTPKKDHSQQRERST